MLQCVAVKKSHDADALWQITELESGLAREKAKAAKFKSWLEQMTEQKTALENDLTQVLCVCVAVCLCVLQCVAVCCSVLQCVAMCCSVLQCVAVCCSVLARAND